MVIKLPDIPSLEKLVKPKYKHSYLRLLNIAQIMRSFVMFGVIMFINQYLLKILEDYRSSVSQSLLMIGSLFLMLFLSHVIFIPYASRFLAYAGVKSAFIASLLCFGVVGWLGFQVTRIEWYPLIFVLWGASACVWWYSFHTFFLEVGDEKKIGREVSMIEMMLLIAGIISPLVFGFVINQFGFGGAAVVTFIGILGSLGVVMFMKDFESLPIVSYKDVFSAAVEHPRHFFAFFAFGMDDCLRVTVWPLYLYFVFKNPLDVGLIAASVAMISAFFLFISGRLSDSISRSKLEHFGAVVVGLSWLARAFTMQPLILTASDVAYRTLYSFFSVPLNAHGMSIGMHTNKAVFVGFRESAVIFGNISVLVFFMIIVAVGLPFYTTFLVGVVIALLALTLRDPISKVDPRVHTYRH